MGNLDAIRDWGYAAEYVEGMWRMLQADEPEDFVLATGIYMTVTDAHKRDAVAAEIAALPPREHNLAVFEAATELLESHYYDSRFFETSEWRRLESRWRGKAACR